jgi:hypothetical protein
LKFLEQLHSTEMEVGPENRGHDERRDRSHREHDFAAERDPLRPI